MSYCRIHDRSMNVFNECPECEYKRDNDKLGSDISLKSVGTDITKSKLSTVETTHKCSDDTVLFCKECAPKRGGDYCGACYWMRKEDKHVWWCRKRLGMRLKDE